MLYKGFRRLGSMWTNETRNEENRMFSELFGVTNSFQQQIDNLVVSSGDSPAEVVQARGEYNLLYQRLDDTDNEINDLKDNVDNTGNEIKIIKDDLDNKFEETNNNINKEINKFVYHLDVNELPTQGLVSAHRGGGLYTRSPVGADNAFSGFDMAIRLGANIIDVDSRMTSDGVLVAMHDRSVSRTTEGAGFIDSMMSNAIPNVNASTFCGSGWDREQVPSVEEILTRYGDRVAITIEAKDGMKAIKPLADLIKKYKLEKSVFINTNKEDEAKEIIKQGILLHYYGVTNETDVDVASNVGAWLVEVPHNSSNTLVNKALNSNIKRVLSKPIWTQTQVNNMNKRLHGHVTDAIGMTNRYTENVLTHTIKASLLANKRGVGWRFFGDWIIKNNNLIYENYTDDDGASVYLGDISTDIPEDSYSISFKWIHKDAGGSNSGMRIRFACNIDDGNALDSTTDGYVANLRNNGQVNLWTSSGNFGNGILIEETQEGNALVEGREYELLIKVTPTRVTVERVDTKQIIGGNNSDWRGGHIYVWATRGGFGKAITDVRLI